MNIYVVVQETKNGSLLLGADVDKETALKQLEYYSASSSTEHYRLAEIELTKKRKQFEPAKSYSEALDFYANVKNYVQERDSFEDSGYRPSKVMLDKGVKARKALERCTERIASSQN